MNSKRITETELQQIRKIPKSPLRHVIVPWFTELWDIIVPWFTELWDILPPDLQICINHFSIISIHISGSMVKTICNKG